MKEIEVLKWVHAAFHSQGWLNYIMEGITYIGEFGLSVMVCALILFIIKKTRYAGFDMAVGIIFNLLIVNVILKFAVNRSRPWTEYGEFIDFYKQFGIRQPTDSSFPSGHTAICFCGAVSLLFSYKIKALPAIIVAVLVALSRIYLCLHYPTDVLGGALIGTACGIGGHYAAKGIFALMRKKFPNFINKLFGTKPLPVTEAPPDEPKEVQPEQPEQLTQEAPETQNSQDTHDSE